MLSNTTLSNLSSTSAPVSFARSSRIRFWMFFWDNTFCDNTSFSSLAFFSFRFNSSYFSLYASFEILSSSIISVNLFRFFSREAMSFSTCFNLPELSSLDIVSSTEESTDSSTSSKLSASSPNISKKAFSMMLSSIALLLGQFSMPLLVATLHFHTGFLCCVSWWWERLVRFVPQKPHSHILLKANFRAYFVRVPDSTFELEW